MKATIAYEILHIFEVICFENLLIFKCRLLEMYSKYKKKISRKTNQSYQNDLCRWKRDIILREIEIRRGIVGRKTLKKRILKEIQ